MLGKISEVARKQLLPNPNLKPGTNDLEINALDHLEIYCANAKQSAFYFCQAFGFKPIAYRGPETGFRESASYMISQGEARLILSTPLRMDNPVAFSLLKHGDTVKDIAFQVENCEAFYYAALRRGAESEEAPVEFLDKSGCYKRAAIKTYGETIHAIIERNGYSSNFPPGFVPYQEIFPLLPTPERELIERIDHIVGNVELGKMEHWVSFYERVLGFKQMIHFSDKDISTEYSALMSKVLRDGSGKIKFPINEPAQGKRKSQIEEYLDFHNGPGVQHIALATNDIISCVTDMRRRGVSFLQVPKTYYDEAPKRVGKIKQDFERLAELGILVDRDDDGYLLQLFTKPVHDRPTLFFEIIQREGSQGFGKGNFKALFEAIERDQALRGNL